VLNVQTQTPNFAMDTKDVDSNADRTQVRFTTHLFDQSLKEFYKIFLSAHLPSDMSIWPPTVLFDAVYAGAVLYNFAVTDIVGKWGDVFCPEAPACADDSDRRRCDQADFNKEDSGRRQNAAQNQCREGEGRGGRRSNRDVIDPYDLVMMYQFQAMEPEKVKAYVKGIEEMAAGRERKGLEENVDMWRVSLVP
jgi:hypothetical protein